MADDTDTPTTKPNDDAELGDGGQKAINAERKARREADKRAADAEARLKELEDAGKGELDRIRDENATLKSRLTELESTNTRLTVAIDKGLSKSQAKRLVGSTAEELEADADEILESFGGGNNSGGATPPPTRRPVEALKGGSEPNEAPVEMDPRKLAESVPRY